MYRLCTEPVLLYVPTVYVHAMSHRPKLSEELYELAEQIQDEYGYGNVDAALKHIAREADYDV